MENPFGDSFGGYREILPERLDPATVEEAIRTVPRELVEGMVVWGTPDQIVRQVADLRDAEAAVNLPHPGLVPHASACVLHVLGLAPHRAPPTLDPFHNGLTGQFDMAIQAR
jgi:alkanesulfonate monooxygenase SsuD/methylene tetrahydromethanopterin reductase-like flavin-dependent oxidoreductase (luciferase family)